MIARAERVLRFGIKRIADPQAKCAAIQARQTLFYAGVQEYRAARREKIGGGAECLRPGWAARTGVGAILLGGGNFLGLKMEIWAVFRHIALFGRFREKTGSKFAHSGPISGRPIAGMGGNRMKGLDSHLPLGPSGRIGVSPGPWCGRLPRFLHQPDYTQPQEFLIISPLLTDLCVGRRGGWNKGNKRL